jgi:hypothetical protein
MTDRTLDLTWVVDPETLRTFVQISDLVSLERLEVDEAMDRVKSLPGFPAGWTPGTNIRIICRRPDPKTIIEVRH